MTTSPAGAYNPNAVEPNALVGTENSFFTALVKSLIVWGNHLSAAGCFFSVPLLISSKINLGSLYLAKTGSPLSFLPISKSVRSFQSNGAPFKA